MSYMDQEQNAIILRQLKLKVTPQRLEVMHCLGDDRSYLSADEVWNRIKPRLGSISLPTVYRILDELVEASVITRIFRSDRKQYYFLCNNQQHHHHFVCESCRRVEDVELCCLEGVAREIASNSGGSVTSHILQINGICGVCSQQGQEESQ
jgi:Fe2+ or Zn2+ uptake regulation protein